LRVERTADDGTADLGNQKLEIGNGEINRRERKERKAGGGKRMAQGGKRTTGGKAEIGKWSAEPRMY
jgi:hypothetical protein